MTSIARDAEALLAKLWPANGEHSLERYEEAAQALRDVGYVSDIVHLVEALGGIVRAPLLPEGQEWRPKALRQMLRDTDEVVRSVADWPFDYLSVDCKRACTDYLWSERYIWLCACHHLIGGKAPEDVEYDLARAGINSRLRRLVLCAKVEALVPRGHPVGMDE